jgi:flagellar assembly protein FliH
MWCRVVAGEATESARPLAWRMAGAPAVAQPDGAIYRDASAPREAPARAHDEKRAEDAYQRGLRDGEAAAARKFTEHSNQVIGQLSRAIEQLALHRSKIHREAEPELVRLSLAIARRILRRELSVDPDALLGLIKAGLEKIESAEAHRVRVHPDHAEALKKQLEGAARPIAVAADPALAVGAVIFETSRGALDAGLETQLAEIERGFADIYPR